MCPQKLGQRKIKSQILKLERVIRTPKLLSLPGSSFHWLPHENLDGSSSPGVNLVVYHVLQSLVISRSQEDLGVHFSARVAAVHYLKEKVMTLIRIKRVRDSYGSRVNE